LRAYLPISAAFITFPTARPLKMPPVAREEPCGSIGEVLRVDAGAELELGTDGTAEVTE
jgi:hypothetical protein